ncbi:eCIS core domain-containing protein [Puia dinghuensis]|uniref:DUF4157 domain-containing protein n=1 Tax=Puia dinghuensis TaxID=1792502 RepID=A0A8J2U9Y7_9BACT|nr:DUF4157 domain-containing protein [Puia dinghuensis]GGA88564.1 hypothetical protein GCM10011511_09750 [Puia dinghuensis]
MREVLSQKPAGAGTGSVPARPKGRPDGSGLTPEKWTYDFGKVAVHSRPVGLQAKHWVSSPGDSDEKEADEIAGKVMRMPSPGGHQDCGCGGTCPNCSGKEDDKDKKVHRKGEGSGGASTRTGTDGAGPMAAPEAPGIVNDVLRSPGEPLDRGTREFMEPRFGHDFSRVRVHRDQRAAESAHAVAARAYTVGRHIVFGKGQYETQSTTGRSLIAHELTHVAQQHSNRLMRAPDFDVDTISDDANVLAQKPFPLPGIKSSPAFSLVYFKYNRHASGEIAKAADYPSQLDPKTDKTMPVKKIPPPDKTPPLSNLPVMAHFFPALWPGRGRALVLGGFHGDEHPGWEITDALVDELKAPGGSEGLGFNTLVIPRVNPGAIEDELSGIKMWRNRCNRQVVDLNRNFPTGDKAGDKGCANTDNAPIQPEVKAVMDVIQKFKPDRILTTHAISELKSGGIFADPNTDPQAIALARRMATTVVHPDTDIPSNKLGTKPKDFNPVYPLDQPGKVSAATSLGAWAPGKAQPGQNIPVITMEAPGFMPLGQGKGTESRTVQAYLRPVRAFLDDPSTADNAADRDIVRDIMEFSAAEQVGFLTGRMSRKNDIFRRIKMRVDTAVANLNAMAPPTTIKVVSNFRSFSDDSDDAGGQSKIDFEKFFLTGSRSGGWDTLPDEFFKDGNRKKGVDKDKWLKTPSKDRLDIILQFSSLPGTSRHHWGTDVDFNSVENKDWQPASGGQTAGKFSDLGDWLQANASKAGFLQAYTEGRKGGYNPEPWHYSYAPIAISLREIYNEQIDLQKDVIDALVTDFSARAAKAKVQMPADFAQALKKINISAFVNDIGPGL